MWDKWWGWKSSEKKYSCNEMLAQALIFWNKNWIFWCSENWYFYRKRSGEDRLQKRVHRVHPLSSPFSPGHGQGVIKWRNRTPGTEVRSEAAVWARGPGSVVDYSIRNSRLWRHRWLAELSWWPAKEGEKGEGIGKATGRRQWRVVTGQLISLRRLSRRGLCF